MESRTTRGGAAPPKPTTLQAFAKLVIGAALSLRYRIEARGMEHIPEIGAALLAPNHVSFIDALAIAKKCKRPIRFVMAKSIYERPLLRALLKSMRVIPIAGAKEDPETLARAFDSISEALRGGELVCVFPEGKLTLDGEIGPFKAGISKILARDPVPVIPVSLGGLWGSVFSKGRHGALEVAKHVVGRREVRVEAGESIDPEEARPEAVREVVAKMRGDKA